MSRPSHFLDTLLTDGGKVVSLTRWPLFTPRKISGTHSCERLSRLCYRVPPFLYCLSLFISDTFSVEDFQKSLYLKNFSSRAMSLFISSYLLTG
jgi:hypothetical protein